MKVLAVTISAFLLAGCSASILHDTTPPRQQARTTNYERGMSVNMRAEHIDSKGNVISMYDPVVHCHTLYYPGKKPERICKLVR
jgi:uncharacterized lipoprotein YajG